MVGVGEVAQGPSHINLHFNDRAKLKRRPDGRDVAPLRVVGVWLNRRTTFGVIAGSPNRGHNPHTDN